MSPSRPLILASASPRRKELLAHLGIDYQVVPSGVDEAELIESIGNVSPQQLVQELALAKASDVFRSNVDSVVIGADTVVVLDGDILGKPTDVPHANSMLSRLSGRTHEVFTGVVVVANEGSQSVAVRTLVTFKDLTSQQIADYVSTGEPMDKAGAYGIQDRAISPVASIEGDYYNVVGLPLDDISSLLAPYYPNQTPVPAQPSL